MLQFLKPFWLQIIKYGGIVLGVILILFRARQSGKEAEEAKSMLETLKGLKTRDKIENNIANINDNKLNKLRSKWTKDK